MIVVTKEVNDYDQYGGYFVGVFETYEDALKEFKRFGRHTPENKYNEWDSKWYEYYEVEVGEVFVENGQGILQQKEK